MYLKDCISSENFQEKLGIKNIQTLLQYNCVDFIMLQGMVAVLTA